MTQTRREGHGWWPYLVPLFGFLILGEIAGRTPAAVQPWFLPAKVLVPGGLFLWFRAQGAYPELRGYRFGAGGAALDFGVGVALGLLWMAPTVLLLWTRSPLWEALPGWLRPGVDAAFDPALLGAGLVPLALLLRGVGYGLVTPFVEELFVRSWLARYADVLDRPVDFRDVPIGRFSWRSFWVVVVFFTVSHVSWEWPVAIAWIVLSQLWFYRRQHMMALVLVHAGSNLAIFFLVWAADGRFTDSAGQPLPLWFFL